MVGDSSLDYRALWEQEAELRRQAEEGRKQEAELRKQEAELRRQAEERSKQAEEGRKQEAELRRQAEEHTQRTTFDQFIRACHNLLYLPVGIADPSCCTKGPVTDPTGRLCPTRLRLWADCLDTQQQLYNSVRKFLHASAENAPRLFPSLLELEGQQRFCGKRLSSEKDLENYCLIAVEDNVRCVIQELCKIPEAQKEFQLEDGVQFDNHAIDDDDSDESALEDQSSVRRPVPDKFLFHQGKGNTNTLLATFEYKPPHKLSVEHLRAGLRDMDLWKEVSQRTTIPTDQLEKVTYKAELLTGSVLAQQYNVMIHKGLEYSFTTNGLAIVLLRVRSDDPSTLYYYLCQPKREVEFAGDLSYEQPITVVSRVLCLCLMSLLSRRREQDWRNDARQHLHRWERKSDDTSAQISEEDRQTAPTSSESQVSEYLESSLSKSPASDDRRPNLRSKTGCRPQETMHNPESMDSSDSDSPDSDPNRTTSALKRTLDQLTSQPRTQRRSRRISSQSERLGRRQQYTTNFCTQRCLLGLKKGGTLDCHCPNVELHRQGRDNDRHLISTEHLVQLLKEQLDETLDYNIRPFGVCGAYGAPFKITCVPYGYTVVGKGTTSAKWNEVSREMDVYRILQKAQGSAVPVFLGAIDLKKIYFLDYSDVRHMLLMSWGGKDTTELEHSQALLHEIERSRKEIRALGVVHGDLRFENVLWNEELGRAQIIDFHRSVLAPRRGVALFPPHFQTRIT
ncbi:hypothetical protein V1525DRAFT_195030 [Lipomyces kononenkoae]|uniref:Uncharacterized protein n=1 Tax=Lipomyces kononenkoae TaxID=34357 RepID=A0ACC3SZ45_LIPKO